MNHENEPDATAADATAAQDTVDPVVEVTNKCKYVWAVIICFEFHYEFYF